MIPGKKISLGGKEYIVPPLNANAMELHKAFLVKTMAGQVDPVKFFDGDFKEMVDVIYSALKRNYPELDRAELGEHVDVRNVAPLFQDVLSAAGFEEGAPGAGE